ncbi:phosphoglucosamine mutase [Caldiplasma sukawensis]
MTERLFGTNGIRGIPNEFLTTEFCSSIGKAIGTYFQGKIAVGSDNRRSKSMILDSVVSGIMSTGANVIYIGEIPTPAIQYYCKIHGIPGVAITASHNPPQFNGIKCIDKDGTELSRDKEEKIEEIYFRKNFKVAGWERIGTRIWDNSAPELYINGVLDKIKQDIKDNIRMKVLVDAGNGAAYYTTPEALGRMGINMTTLNCNPDGLFTSRQSEPKPENLREFIQLMKTGTFDIGVAHDGDADRAIFSDENGNFIDGDKTLALFVKHFARPGDRVVTPISSSDAIDDIGKEMGVEIIRTRIGAPIVSRTMIEKKARLGGEENGGIIFGDHQYCRDGLMTVGIIISIISRSGKKLSQLIRDLPQYNMVRRAVEFSGDFEPIREKVKELLGDYEFLEIDGIKARKGHDWILIRPSGTEPIVRVFTHSTSMERAEELMKKVLPEITHS